MRTVRQSHNITSRHRGFTMMEIVVAVVMIGIMFSIAMPTMRNMNESNKLRNDVRQIISLLKFARSEAVFNESTTHVFLDTEKREFWMYLGEPRESKSGNRSSSTGKKAASMYESKRQLSSGVYFPNVAAVSKDIIKDKIVAIDFFPDGSSSGALFTVANKTDKSQTVEVLKSTGLLEVTAGTIQDKEQKNAENPNPLPPGRDGGGW